MMGIVAKKGMIMMYVLMIVVRIGGIKYVVLKLSCAKYSKFYACVINSKNEHH